MSQPAENFSPSLDVADEVRDFYDRYPYPPPVDNLEKYQRQWQDRDRRRADFHLFWPGRPYREDQSILVAGCGTSQAAKHALRWPTALVTGIDCSATSVRHTEELKKKYKLENLQVRQLAIERISDLGMTFDQIVCTGVLHHLADPDAGLSALRSVLQPFGAMQLMVYAPYGRTGIYMHARVLPAARDPRHRREYPGSCRCTRCVASRTPSAKLARSGSGFSK